MTRRVRNIFLAAGAFSGLLALGGCGGGGGGGGNGLVGGGSFEYPSSLTAATSADGFAAPYALDPAAKQLHYVQQNIVGAGTANGQLTITVAAIPLPSGPSPEPGFVVIFDPASSTSQLLDNSPIGILSTLSPQCANCLRTDTVAAGGGAGQVTFTYLDPSSIGLNYSVLGMWSKPTTVSSTWLEVGAPFSAGVLTRGIDLPTIGSADYRGYFIGRFATSSTTGGLTDGTYLVGANAQAHAEFSGAGAVTFATTNTNISRELGGGMLQAPSAEPRLNLTSTALPIDRSSSTINSFAGTVLSTDQTNGFFLQSQGNPGQIAGGFYGQPAATAPFAPPEAGGAVAISNSASTPTQSLVGSFALKKTP